MARKKLYMETTKIEASRTASEIVAELVRSGATSINTDYQNGQISGLRWIMKINVVDALFEMPARVDPVAKILGRRDQAERVAWRQLLRWVQAQNAMIDTGMVKPGEVYFAYAVHPGTNRTIFEYITETQFKALPAPEQKQ